mmetsp:Transcript_17348/g.29701  ORF Transcript_17348/g.29701 Transcript_17348/m.29701 type:complete len:387 (+) Transcript_17348:33-1193(+)
MKLRIITMLICASSAFNTVRPIFAQASRRDPRCSMTKGEDLGKKSTADDVVTRFGASGSLSGKTAVVTGGNSGIGLETVRVLAENGCKVILCSRSVEAGEVAKASLQFTEGADALGAAAERIIVKALDLSDLKSVETNAKSIADEVAAGSLSPAAPSTSTPQIDFLVLNAGILALPTLQRTPQGFEKQVGVNHFGHFHLAQKLLPLVAQKGSRVVVLSSTAHTMGGKVDCEDLNYNKEGGEGYTPWGAYGRSKACNMLFAKALSTRLAPFGASAFSVHPGVVATNLWREEQGPAALSKFADRFLPSFVPRLKDLLPKIISDKSIAQGAATTMYACLCPSLPATFPGAYLKDCDVAEVGKDYSSDPDGAFRERLWEATERDILNALK